MARRRKSSVLEFFEGFQVGQKIGSAIGGAIKGARMEGDLADAAQSNRVTESASPEEAAAAVPQIQAARDAEIQRQVDAGADPIETAAKVGQQYAPAIREADRKSGLTSTEYNVGDRAYGQKSAADIAARGLNFQAMSDVYAKYGEPEKAARMLANGLSITKVMQAQADDDELRQALTPDRGAASLRARSSIGTGADIIGASGVLGVLDNPSGTEKPASPAGGGQGNNPTRFDFDHYVKSVAPRALDVLVKQGRMPEAKAFRDFLDTEEGRGYARSWATGVHRLNLGDYTGALQSFERLYSSQGYDDGHTVKLVPLDEAGKQYRIEQYSSDGKLLGSKTGATADLANQAAGALSPSSLVKYRVERQMKAEAEAATLDRQIQLEQLRQQGREYSEDRRDERLAKRLEAQQNRSRVTLTQERGNAEIDAARETVSGLSPEDIRKRTSPTTATGRENLDFDPSLARAAKLAARRKIGDDPWFDQRYGGGQGQTQSQQPAASTPRTPIAEASASLANDPAMKGYRLGNQTANGFEVLDESGKRVGYYRRQR